MEATTLNKTEWLLSILAEHLDEKSNVWFRDWVISLSGEELMKKFNLLFSLVSRNIPAITPVLSAEQQKEADRFYPCFARVNFSLQQLCRVLMMMRLPVNGNIQVLNTVFDAADMNELATLYRGLYWLDNAPDFAMRMAEGIRTNMVDVFDAIVCNNPYPFYYLGEDAWNQMVLKAIFNGRPLYKVYKLRERKNQPLALILHDFVHERWSAGRTVTPELWQLMPGFVTHAIAEDLRTAAQSQDPYERNAALKALNESGFDDTVIAATWEETGMAFNNKKN